MNAPSPGRWSDQLWRSALTLLATTVALYFAWQLLSAAWPVILVMGCLALVIRIAIGSTRRSEW